MESSPQSSALFNNASLGIIVVNSAGFIESINPFALSLFGYTMQEVVEKPVAVLIPQRFHHKNQDSEKENIHHARSSAMGVGMELYAVKKNGTKFYVEVSLGNYQNNGNENMIAFLSDISVRKKAETEIKKLNDELELTVTQRTQDLRETLGQLQISRDKLEDVLSYQKALLDNAGAMIIATDSKGIIKIFNQEAVHTTGYQASEAINRNTLVLLHDKNEIEKRRKELLKLFDILIEDDFAVLVEKSRRNIHEEDHFNYIRKDGTFFPVSLTISAIIDTAGQITGFMAIAIDISARKKAEEDLLNALKKEKELSELKSRFVSMASHEFRTPLSTVLSSAYLIDKYATSDDQPKREKHLHRIISSVTMLTDILNDFLSVGKIEEGKIQVRQTQLNIREVITAIAEEIKNNLKKQQQIHYHHQGNPNVVLDASLLKHIVMNLISNASKFSPESSVIKIKTINRDQHILLSVKDNGIGISEEDQQHLMERFFRGANAGNIHGTGLGLHIISKYAELMNGTVECKSELEKGSEFIITFYIQNMAE